MNNHINKQLINWFAKQNIDIQNIIIKEQKNEYYKLKNKQIDITNIEIKSFIKAIETIKEKVEPLSYKNKTLNIDNIKNNKIRIIANKKVRVNKKAEKLLNYKSLICELVVADYSTREIAKYLFKKNRFSVSHTMISQFINTTIKGKEDDK